MGRKKPFSGKKKKQQLKEKKIKKKARQESDDDLEGEKLDEQEDEVRKETTSQPLSAEIIKINYQKYENPMLNVNRFALHFFKESDEEIKKRKLLSYQPLEPMSEQDLEIKVDQVFLQNELAFPKRPKKDYSISVSELDKIELKYFEDYLQKLEREFGSLSNLSYFEMNLETWRQFWRVIEMSDIILFIVDSRHPLFHFPSSVYDYVVSELGKDLVLVLNKIDLIPASLVLAWINYLQNVYPNLKIIPFASFAGMKVKEKGTNKGRFYGKLKMAFEGSKKLLATCQAIVQDRLDLSSWSSKIEKELTEEKNPTHFKNDYEEYVEDDDDDNNKNALESANQKFEKLDLSYHEWKQFDKEILTIGFIGHPNVGKSSLINAIIGKKVVSVSRTPGHTKHFQTIFLTNNVKLCDCPGLVFPSKISKQMQVLMGSFPISQVREPYTSIGFLTQRINLPKLLRLKRIDQDVAQSSTWSAFEVCESWAEMRGFVTSKTGHPDIYRAANHLLRMALDGRTLCLAFYPPNYCKERDEIWSKREEIPYIKYLQNQYLSPAVTQSHDCNKKSSQAESDSEDESKDNLKDESDDKRISASNRFEELQ